MIRPVVYSRTHIPGTILRERRQRLATHSIGTPFVRISEDVPVRFSTTANIDTSSKLGLRDRTQVPVRMDNRSKQDKVKFEL